MRFVILLNLLLMLSVSLSAQIGSYRTKAKELVTKMTLEEKASLCSGADSWYTKPVERLGIPAISVSDGPHGLRKADGGGIGKSLPATCFPTGSALGASWNVDLLHEVGEALGVESQSFDVQILLGPGINMKRSPLAGRNFEYYSEDPALAGQLATAFVQGVQSQGVGACVKHFTANNQEYERMANNSNVDERTLHEIYLPAFETVVREAQPWSIMCAYNLVNGVYASEHQYLLEEVLKNQWGFDGFVVSDWFAVSDRVAGVAARLHLEMPGNEGLNDAKIVAAVKNGELPEARLDQVVEELLAVILMAHDRKKEGVTFDIDQHHRLARKAGGESIVLLKNEGSLLPLPTDGSKKIAVIGDFARQPRFQGGGSSQVNPSKIDKAYDELDALIEGELTFASAYQRNGETTDQLLAEARSTAQAADIAVVFVGLPAAYESESFDRAHMNLPPAHNQLVETVTAVQPNTVVVLINGSAVSMPWAGQAPAIVEGWLGGQAGGGALADVLAGKVNPSGKLSESFPVRLEDTPTFLTFPGTGGESLYGEGPYIGYRYYDSKHIEPLFPFGHGLSYTTFEYTKIQTDRSKAKDTEQMRVDVTVKNTGKVAGKEVVQLYVSPAEGVFPQPEKALRKFVKVELQPGEQKTVSFELGFRDFANYDPRVHAWQVTPGTHTILAGGSSADLPLRQTIELQATQTIEAPLTRYSMFKELMAHPKGKPYADEIWAAIFRKMAPEPAAEEKDLTPEEKEEREVGAAMMAAFFGDIPLFKMPHVTAGRFSEQRLEKVLEELR